MGVKAILETAEVVLVQVLVRGLDRLTLKTLSVGVSCGCDWALLLLRLGDFLLGEELPPPWAGDGLGDPVAGGGVEAACGVTNLGA